MKNSITTKLLLMCFLLVLVSTGGISVTYYVLARQEKQEESRQRIQIAFEIIRDDYLHRIQNYPAKLQEFLTQDSALTWLAFTYSQNTANFFTKLTTAPNLVEVSNKLKKFGQAIAADRLLVYGADRRLLLAYERKGAADTVGGYLISQTGHDAYVSFDDSEYLAALLIRHAPIPDVPLPEGIAGAYPQDLPTQAQFSFFTEQGALGQRIEIPIVWKEQAIGVLIGEIFYTRDMIDRYALLSKTEVNLFARDRLSVGTLPVQAVFEAAAQAGLPACDAIMAAHTDVAVVPVMLDRQTYYQGQCVFKTAQESIGALTVSLSQAVEKQKIRKSLFAILTVSGIFSALTFGLAFVFSQKATSALLAIVKVMGAAAQGDLRTTAPAAADDEIGLLAHKLNQLIVQLRTISTQVQGTSAEVNTTAITILGEMETLIEAMEQQSSSVDLATESVEKINCFIENVARKSAILLAAVEQILTSIQETHASIREVTLGTSSLTQQLYRISTSLDQANQSVKLISDAADHLTDAAQQIDQDIHQVDQSFQEITHHATQTQALAQETLEAANRGQSSVEVSLQGMADLKFTITNTAQIIQEVDTWGERVSSILDIVDDITEQTSLLALNASIISAQAGVHGRGFAVVANEIKDLAVRTKASTKEIGVLVYELQLKTVAGVKQIAQGSAKVDQEIALIQVVKESLASILDRATRSFQWTTDTTRVIRQTVANGQAIHQQMTRVTAMVIHAQTAIREEEQNIQDIVAAVEAISCMSEQVNHANVEQQSAANQIMQNMGEMTTEFESISTQTETLKQEVAQIVNLMHTLNLVSDQVLRNASDISGNTVQNLVQQAHILRQIVNIFKLS